jgi:hypothetical protein
MGMPAGTHIVKVGAMAANDGTCNLNTGIWEIKAWTKCESWSDDMQLAFTVYGVSRCCSAIAAVLLLLLCVFYAAAILLLPSGAWFLSSPANPTFHHGWQRLAALPAFLLP